jgi:hypothetical protein
LFRVAAQSFSDGIHPDVPGYAFHGVGFAENVVVETLLPQWVTVLRTIVERRVLFEAAYNIEELARVSEPLTEKVQMIGHEAIGMNGKSVAVGNVR